jgi:hypothetical protein
MVLVNFTVPPPIPTDTVGVEVAGGFGPQAQRFVKTVVEWAGNVHDVSVFG